MVPKKIRFFNTAAVARPFPHLQRAALSAGGAFLRGARCAKCGAQCAKCGDADLRGVLSAGARGRYEALGQHYPCYAWKIFVQPKHAYKRLGQPALTLPAPPRSPP